MVLMVKKVFSSVTWISLNFQNTLNIHNKKKKMKDITVLSSACGAFFMPGFFKCLKENKERNITIIGADLSCAN